ncbi:30S ribosomal protein S2 [Bacteroidetes/Chlorobi group bacterium ChocPot_Mid]|nr:MAG: 30S ribosomal protein S2 [Bacteroidetes/Chlorobi group bacterium ChocPot_Mid]
MSHYVSIEQLLEAGAHFGHLTRRWNPKMAPFIFNERNGIHIIDLRKTQILIDIARQAIHDIASSGRIIMFVGTKSQSRKIVEEKAQSCNQPYVVERWLGGMLTNFATIRKSIKRLNGIDKMEVDGTFDKITKKERLLLTRERDRLRTVFGGIEEMTRLPGALFVVDIKKEHIAVKEAKILGIPVIALVDTNCDPEDVDFPIPCNDDSVKAIEIISDVFAKAINDGNSIANARRAELEASGERGAKESDLVEEDPKIKRKMRARKPAGGVKKTGKRPRKEDENSKSDVQAQESNEVIVKKDNQENQNEEQI